MGSQDFIQKDMSFNEIKRLRLQFLSQAEATPQTPYDDETALGLIFPAGLIWYCDAAKTVQFTVEEYNGDSNPTPVVLNVARHVEIPVTGTSPITFAHNLGSLANVQFMDNSTRVNLTPTQIQWFDLNNITVAFTGTWDATALVTG